MSTQIAFSQITSSDEAAPWHLLPYLKSSSSDFIVIYDHDRISFREVDKDYILQIHERYHPDDSHQYILVNGVTVYENDEIGCFYILPS